MIKNSVNLQKGNTLSMPKVAHFIEQEDKTNRLIRDLYRTNTKAAVHWIAHERLGATRRGFLEKEESGQPQIRDSSKDNPVLKLRIYKREL